MGYEYQCAFSAFLVGKSESVSRRPGRRNRFDHTGFRVVGYPLCLPLRGDTDVSTALRVLQMQRLADHGQGECGPDRGSMSGWPHLNIQMARVGLQQQDY